jgi:DNA-3-methyladenine glycosylase I
MTQPLKRCVWCGTDPLYCAYHDKEWGTPQYDGQSLFEFLCLEGMQAGLSWITILKRRPGYRAAFANFQPEKIARFPQGKLATLQQDTRIIRHAGKIAAIQNNARAWLKLAEQQDPATWLWHFVDGVPIHNRWKNIMQVPVETELSRQLAKALKQRGFQFVGPTICYAFMQAVGMVNDHLTSCFRWKELSTRIKS